jgi:hypothetical protein
VIERLAIQRVCESHATRLPRHEAAADRCVELGVSIGSDPRDVRRGKLDAEHGARIEHAPR